MMSFGSRGPLIVYTVYILYMYMYVYIGLSEQGAITPKIQWTIIAVVPIIINIAIWGETQFSAHPICRFVYNLVYIYTYIII